MKARPVFTGTFALLLNSSLLALGQMSADNLDQLLGPVALYPDPLIAQLLPAATQPGQITMADQAVQGGLDPNQIDAQPWDDSVKALARYPAVLTWLDNNMPWTTALGQAFAAQPDDVMSAVQRLRAQAQLLGNLNATPQEQVVDSGGNIEILPAQPDTIYVPIYQPAQVYYEPPPLLGGWVSFGFGLPIGGWLNSDFDWRHRNIFAWSPDHFRPRGWWQESPGRRLRPENTAIWRPHGPQIRVDRGYSPNSGLYGSTPWSSGAARPLQGARSGPAAWSSDAARPVGGARSGSAAGSSGTARPVGGARSGSAAGSSGVARPVGGARFAPPTYARPSSPAPRAGSSFYPRGALSGGGGASATRSFSARGASSRSSGSFGGGGRSTSGPSTSFSRGGGGGGGGGRRR